MALPRIFADEILRTRIWRTVSQMDQLRWLPGCIDDQYPEIVKFIPGKTCIVEAGYAGAAKRTGMI